MIYQVTHRTRFRYPQQVSFARCNLRLEPIDWPGQTLDSYELEITPPAEQTHPVASGYPVKVTRVLIDTPARELIIESRSRLTVSRETPIAAADDPTVEEVAAAAAARPSLAVDAPANYLYPSPTIPLDPDIAAWALEELAPERGIVEALIALTTRAYREFRYDGEATDLRTPIAEAFAKRHGVCQDFAQVLIAGTRAAGLPAAYVSGYLRTIPPPGKARLVGADATHAWLMVWCGEARGWVGFDPTNDCTVGSNHIVTAIGRDYGDIAPIDGIFLGRNSQDIDVSVDVEPIED